MKNILIIIGGLFFFILMYACEKEPMKGSVTDVDGNIYQTVKIGEQWWMAENLKTTKYKDGMDIPNVLDLNAWKVLTSGAYCWYNNDETTYRDQFGALYNWYSVGSNNLCPSGWHVPTDSEWKTLEIKLGMNPTGADGYDDRGTDQGLQLKVNGTSGFEGELAGARDLLAGYIHFSDYGYFWTSTTSSEDADWAYDRVLKTANSLVRRNPNDKKDGFSVRCVKDN